MAVYSQTENRFRLRILVFSLFLACSQPELTTAAKPEVELATVEYWAGKIGDKTAAFAEDVMATSYLKQAYESYDMKVEMINATELAAEMARKLEQFFSWKIKALRSLAEKAEKAEKDFIDSDKELQYYAAKKLVGLKLSFDPHFGVPINTSESVVHIPTEVFDQAARVAKDIKWTKKLNKVFKDNLAMFPDLSWQYFGSAEGIHRQYPAREWPVSVGVPDLYDARRRPWYIQGASSPKDVVILIDRSGSLLGLRTQIAKLASSVIVETLSTNDFFQVVLFNNESKLICCEEHGLKLLQATRINKEYIKHKLTEWVATSTADWKSGLELAFKLLKETKKNNEGTQCQQALLILSDGSASYEDEIFAKYNFDKSVRVFTFAVGPPQYSVKELKQMACNNKGYFLRIPSVGTVWETVTSYIKVLSRPVGVQEMKPTVFTSVFVDATGGGLVSTGSTPVFKNSNTSMGHNGYVFAVDNNGLILIHPGINEDKLGKLVPQPNMDLSQLEFSTTNESFVKELRDNMILSERGKQKFEAYIKSKDDLRVQKHIMQYHYFRTPSSPFSIGIASPEFGYSILKPVIDFKQGRKALETVQEIKGWPYCSKLWNKKNLKGHVIKIIEHAISNNLRNPNKCDQRMLRGLLLDAVITNRVVAIWKNRKEIREKENVHHVFLRTHFGVIRSTNSSKSHSTNNQSNESTFENEPGYYGRVVQREQGSLLFSVTSGNSRANLMLSVYAPVKLIDPRITVAVTGLRMNYTYFARKFLIEETMSCPGGRRCDMRLTCDRAQKNRIEGMYCYMLDENGFVVASNEQEDVGKFFGLIDSKLMASLIINKTSTRAGIYNTISLPDYQASCQLVPQQGSSASRIGMPLISITSFISSLITSVIGLLSKITVYSLMNLKEVPSVNSAEERATYISCVKRNIFYLADTKNGSTSYSGEAKCGADACSRKFAVSKVRKTNLYLLAVDSSCGKCKSKIHDLNDLPGIPGTAKAVYDREIYTKPSNTTRVRRRPPMCYSTKNENNDQCGGSTSLKYHCSLMASTISFVFFFVSM